MHASNTGSFALPPELATRGPWILQLGVRDVLVRARRSWVVLPALLLAHAFALLLPAAADVMAFSGAAPETVNGRLAMLGFVAALGAELSSGESIFAQISEQGSATWIIYAFVLFIGASLIPIFKVSMF